MNVNEPEEDGREQPLSETLTAVVDAMMRRRWLLIGAVAVSAVASALILSLMPRKYTSEATLLVNQQEVSPQVVLPAASSRETFDALMRRVLSQERMLRIAEKTGLRAAPKESSDSDALVEQMRKQLKAEVLEAARNDPANFTAFKVSFTANSAQVAYDVVGEMARVFIEYNQKSQTEIAGSTVAFLTRQIESRRMKLIEQEQRMQDFSRKHGATVPQSQQAALAALIDLRAQLQNVANGQARARQQRVALETALRSTLAKIQADRSAMMQYLTAEHPQVVKKTHDEHAVEALIERYQGEGASARTGDVVLLPDYPAVSQAVAQLEMNVLEREGLAKDEKRLAAAISNAENTVTKLPMHEQELGVMQREYDVLAQDFRDLKAKLQQAEMAADLTKKREGQQFKLIDPPTYPKAPSSPKKAIVALAGIAVGLVLGIGASALQELRNDSVRREAELTRLCGIACVVSIPSLLSEREQKRQEALSAVDGIAMFAAVAVVLAAEIFIVASV